MRSLPDIGVYPPFDGFPREGVRFLRQLKRNNNRPWFNAHKPNYEDLVKLPMQSLVAALQPGIARFAPEIDVNPKRALFRIYRDTRFSNDKTPYKTHIAAVFHPRGQWQESAGYYVHVEPGGVYAGGGIYMPNGDQLRKLRRSIADRGNEFHSIVGSRVFRRRFREIEGEKLQRVPQGFDRDHPMAQWLKYKQFFAGVQWKVEECYTASLVGKIVKVYKDLYPFVRFLNDALGQS